MYLGIGDPLDRSDISHTDPGRFELVFATLQKHQRFQIIGVTNTIARGYHSSIGRNAFQTEPM